MIVKRGGFESVLKNSQRWSWSDVGLQTVREAYSSHRKRTIANSGQPSALIVFFCFSSFCRCFSILFRVIDYTRFRLYAMRSVLYRPRILCEYLQTGFGRYIVVILMCYKSCSSFSYLMFQRNLQKELLLMLWQNGNNYVIVYSSECFPRQSATAADMENQLKNLLQEIKSLNDSPICSMLHGVPLLCTMLSYQNIFT